MTCAHVLGLIDAGPFAAYPRAHLEAAWQHARQCGACGSALKAAAELAIDLAALPQPAHPAGLPAAVMTRIARIDEASARDAAAFTGATAPIARQWSMWGTVLGGLAAALAIVLSMASSRLTLLDIASVRVGAVTPSLGVMPSSDTWAIVLGIGLVLYILGLFAPLRPVASSVHRGAGGDTGRGRR